MTYIPSFLLQIEITSSNKWIDVDLNPSGAPDVREVSIAEGTYDDIRAVVSALQTALQAEDGTFGVTVTALNTKGRLYIGRIGDFDILWKTGTHGSDNADSHIGTLLGYDDSADDSGSYYYNNDNSHMYGYYDTVGLASDSYDEQQRIGGATFEADSGKCYRTTWATHEKRTIQLQKIPQANFFEADSATNESFETFWLEAASGTPFKFYTDKSNPSGSDQGSYCLIVAANETLTKKRESSGSAYYDKQLLMKKQP